jgi:hypothetical protein
MTTALEKVRVQVHLPAAKKKKKKPGIQRTTGPIWTVAENLLPPEFDPRTVQPVASRYTDYATLPAYVKVHLLNYGSLSSKFGVLISSCKHTHLFVNG